MPKIKPIVLITLLACAITSSQVAFSMDLNQFRWKNRLLLLFAADDSDASLRALNSEISAQPQEIADRDLVVFSIFESGFSSMGKTQIEKRTAAALREKLAAPPGGFTCILIGKDGGVKLRQATEIKLAEIFALIDSMPMRQEEMRQKSQGGAVK